MSIQIYNTQSKKKEEFKPVHDGEVRMYVCGPTVYDFLHVGNYRGAIFFNVVRNWFEKQGLKVSYIYNFTDVDDKIINKSNETGQSCKVITEKYIAEFKKDYADLNLKPHTQNPRVTEYMKDIIDFIKTLVEKNHAYAVDGDVYYDVKSFGEYGKLSNMKVDEMESGSRVEVDPRKKNPSDFALWKSAKEGEPSWTSPWGEGRPGWHIECSCMAKSILGDTIDIHGGGIDLVFPHHENEIAQSEGCTGKNYVNYWMHNNMIEFGNEKMSKSLGNIKTGRAFLEEYNGEILKFMMLSAHYRSPIDFSEDQVARTVASLGKFYSALALAEKLVQSEAQLAPIPDKFQKQIEEADQSIIESMNDDFNTAEVTARLFEVTRSFNNFCRKPGKVTPEMKAIAEVYSPWLKDKGEFLALFQEPAANFLTTLDDMLLRQKELSRTDIDKLVSDRSAARDNKDFAKSDEIRDQLIELGISVMDTPEGSIWEVTK